MTDFKLVSIVAQNDRMEVFHVPINSFNPSLHSTVQRQSTQGQRIPVQGQPTQGQSSPVVTQRQYQQPVQQPIKKQPCDAANLAQGEGYFVPETEPLSPRQSPLGQNSQESPQPSFSGQDSQESPQPSRNSASMQSSRIDDTIESADKLAGGILKYSKKALGHLEVFTLRALKKGFTMVENFKETRRFKKSKHMIHTKLYDCNVLPETGEAQLISYRGKKKTITLPSFVKTKAGTFTVTSIAPKFLSFQTVKSVIGNATNSQILETDVADFKDFTGEIASVELPERLVYIPSKAFAFSGKITYLHIPSSVTRVAISAFQWSNISYLKFYGPCPVGLRDAKLPSSCIVLYKKSYAEQYAFLGMQGKAMKGR